MKVYPPIGLALSLLLAADRQKNRVPVALGLCEADI